MTIVTVGATLYRALEAAAELESKYGLSAEVIDARFINPLNYGPIVESVKKTGKVVLASDACERGSFLHTMASNISQLAFDYLGCARWRWSARAIGSRRAAEMEEAFFPQKEWMLDAIHERIMPLPGHQVTTRQATSEILTRNQMGI